MNAPTRIDDGAWEELTIREPALLRLECDVRRAAARLLSGDPETIDQIWAGRGGLKRRLCALVGWDAANPIMRTSTAYEAAYRHLYDLLEDADEIMNGVGN